MFSFEFSGIAVSFKCAENKVNRFSQMSEPTSDSGYSVVLRHRPRRIAFLVDPETTPPEALREIVSFNVDVWGGRHNPIIPISKGRVWPDYWRLLTVVDPDLIYTYVDLAEQTIAGLDEKLTLLKIERHQDYGPPPNYNVQISDQARTDGILGNLGGHFSGFFWPPRTQPRILSFGHSQRSEVSDFTRWNLGCSDRASFLVRDGNVPGTTSAPDDPTLLREVAGDRNIVLPIHVCADAPLAAIAKDGQQHDEFLIHYGESVWNQIEFWNSVYFRGRMSLIHASLQAIWLTPAFVLNDSAFGALIGLIKARVYSSSGGQRAIQVVSYDETDSSMQDLALRICREARSDFYGRASRKLQPGTFPQCQPSQHTQFGFHNRPTDMHQYARGKTAFLDVNTPAELQTTNFQGWKFMMDVRVYDPVQEETHGNANPWFMLPARSALSDIFCQIPARILRTHELSVEVTSNTQHIRIDIPDVMRIFAQLISPHTKCWETADLRYKLLRNRREHSVGLSEKGKYFEGILGLFESRASLAYVFDHPFWRSVIERLSLPPQSPQLREKVSSDVKKLASGILSEHDKTTDWLVEEVMRISQKVPKTAGDLTLAEIERLQEKFLNGLSPEKRESVVHSSIREDATKLSAEELSQVMREILVENISSFTAQNVLLQGTTLQCTFCKSRAWYHVGELDRTVACQGCRRNISLPAESVWSYKLNPLIGSGVREHGIMPVARTVARLSDFTGDCYLLKAGLCAYKFDSEGYKPDFEVDLAWIKNGEFGIAEVKSSALRFRKEETEKLLRIARFMRPDHLLLACLEGEKKRLDAICERLKVDLAGTGIRVEVWGPKEFETPAMATGIF